MKTFATVVSAATLVLSASAFAWHSTGPIYTDCEAAKRHLTYLNGMADRNKDLDATNVKLKKAHYQELYNKNCMGYK